MLKIGKPLPKSRPRPNLDNTSPITIRLSKNFDSPDENDDIVVEGDAVIGDWLLDRYSANDFSISAVILMVPFEAEAPRDMESAAIQNMEQLSRLDLTKTFDQYPAFFRSGESTTFFILDSAGPSNPYNMLTRRLAQVPNYEEGSRFKNVEQSSTGITQDFAAMELDESTDSTMFSFATSGVDEFFNQLISAERPMDLFGANGRPTLAEALALRDSNGFDLLTVLYSAGKFAEVMQILTNNDIPSVVLNTPSELNMTFLGYVVSQHRDYPQRTRNAILNELVIRDAMMFPMGNVNENAFDDIINEEYEIITRCVDVQRGSTESLTRMMIIFAKKENSSGEPILTRMILDGFGDADRINTLVDGETPLIAAAKAGNRSVINLLLQSGARVDVRDSYRKTAAEYALEHEIELEELGYGDRASVDSIVDAVRRRDEEETIRLLETNGININTIFFDDEGEETNVINFLVKKNALEDTAASHPWSEFLEVLLTRTTLTGANLLYIDRREVRTVIQETITYGKTVGLAMIMRLGKFDPNIVNPMLTSRAGILDALVQKKLRVAGLLAMAARTTRQTLVEAFLYALRNYDDLDDVDSMRFGEFFERLFDNEALDIDRIISVDGVDCYIGDLVRGVRRGTLTSEFRAAFESPTTGMATPLDVDYVNRAFLGGEFEELEELTQLLNYNAMINKRPGLFFSEFIEDADARVHILAEAMEKDVKLFDMFRQAGMTDYEGVLLTAVSTGNEDRIPGILNDEVALRNITSKEIREALSAARSQQARDSLREELSSRTSASGFSFMAFLEADDAMVSSDEMIEEAESIIRSRNITRIRNIDREFLNLPVYHRDRLIRIAGELGSDIANEVRLALIDYDTRRDYLQLAKERESDYYVIRASMRKYPSTDYMVEGRHVLYWATASKNINFFMAVIDELGSDVLDVRIGDEFYLYPITAAIIAGFPMEVIIAAQPNPGRVDLKQRVSNERGFNMEDFIEASDYPDKRALLRWWMDTREII